MSTTLTGWDGDVPTFANSIGLPATTPNRAAQSFTIPSTTNCNGCQVKLRNNNGDVSTAQCRIETDTTGAPSGTLVDANASVDYNPTGLNSSTMAYAQFVFPASFALSAGVTYWLVCKRKTETGNFTNHSMGYAVGNPYPNGVAAGWNSVSWTTALTGDVSFAIFGPDPIGTIGGVDQNKMLMGCG